jgi:hypothetical protein
MTLARWLILLGSLVLFAAALLHVIGGFFYLIPALVKAGIDPRLVATVKCVWLVFTVELVLLTPAFVWISRRPDGRSLLLYLALVPLIDGVLMYYFVGPFIGSNMVAGGTLLLLIGAWLLPRGHTSGV